MSRQTTIGKLPEISVRNAKGKDKPYKLSDGGGLYLLVNPNSSKYWRLKYRLHGKEKTLSLGVYPGVSMAEARQEANKAKKLIREGVDPVIRRRQEKHTKTANTFRNIAEEWLTKQKGSWTKDHTARVSRTLERDVYPQYRGIHHAQVSVIHEPYDLLSSCLAAWLAIPQQCYGMYCLF